LQSILRNRQDNARILAMQQDQRRRRRPGRTQQKVVVLGRFQRCQAIGFTAPLPHDLAANQQGDSVQLQEAWSVGRIQPEPGRRLPDAWH